MATYIIHEVWYNLCIQFSSVNKGRSLLSPFTSIGSHVQYLTLAILVPAQMFCHVRSCTYSHSLYTQPNILPLCVPVWWKPFRLVSCSRGTKQVEALCKYEASLWSWFHSCFRISPRKTCTCRRSEPDSFCKTGIYFVLANKPAWFTFDLVSCFKHPLYLAHLCVMYPTWNCWESKLAFTLSSGTMVKKK